MTDATMTDTTMTDTTMTDTTMTDTTIDPFDVAVDDILAVTEECIERDELKNLLKFKKDRCCYDGFEPSGRMHIAQGILKTIIVNRLTKHGFKFKFWVADWFAKMNHKLGGDLKKIRKVGEYMIEIWKSCGMDLDNVEFLWSSDEIVKSAGEYMEMVIDISCTFNLSRIKRCGQIMGRDESDSNPASQILYPCMQCADIFYIGADVAQLGMDQRKVNMLAREYASIKRKKGTKQERNRFRFSPVVLSHHMLMGLMEGQEKMSKSNPDSAIFMEDTEAEVKRKIRKAFCVPCEVKGNPCMDYMRHIVFNVFDTVKLLRTREEDVEKDYICYKTFENDYINGTIHPNDLKLTLTECINKLLEPTRTHFETNTTAKQLLKTIKSYHK